MQFICPKCGTVLPSWWKIAHLFRHFHTFECPNCGVLIEVGVRHEGLHRHVVTALFLLLVGWVFLLEVFETPVLFVDKVWVLNCIGELNYSEKYTLPFILAIVIL